MLLGIGRGYFAGWGTLALLNAGIAQGKNRSGFNSSRPTALPPYRPTVIRAAATISLSSRSRVGPW